MSLALYYLVSIEPNHPSLVLRLEMQMNILSQRAAGSIFVYFIGLTLVELLIL
jgi:hypothetical protein